MSKTSIFGAYDVRGVYSKDLLDEDAFRIAVACAKFVGKKIVVARDNRISSPALSKEFTRGLLETGKNVFDAGIIPTPVLYYATAFLNTGGGAMITASHNPAEYNGIKLCKGTMPLSTEEMKKLEQEFTGNAEKNRASNRASKKGVLENVNVEGDYVKHVRSLTSFKKSVKIVADAGNGVCGEIAGKIFDLISVDYSPIYFESDGRFPHHPPDPSKEENISELKRRVPEEKADLGIAFDGDGDRVAFTDELGNATSPDDAGLLLVEKRLQEKPGAIIVYELRSSMSVREKILEWGGKPLMVKAGRIAVREAMQETGAEIGFETSGHICFKENYGFDDGLYASAKMIELVSHADELLSHKIKQLPHYQTTRELRLHCPAEKKFVVVNEVKKELKKSFKVNELDGVRVETSESWGLLRASNTEPAVTLRFEAKNDEKLEEIYSTFSETLSPHGIKLPPLKQAMQ